MMKKLIDGKFLKRLKETLEPDLIGFSSTGDYRSFDGTLPPFFDRYGAAISVGVRLSSGILEEISDCPTASYLAHYRQVNFKLDRITLEISAILEKELGVESFAVPASQITNWNPSRGLVSHKVFAFLSGLAFRGLNNLAVTQDFGAQVRWATVLARTEAQVEPEALRPKSFCDECLKCVSACPAGAISNQVESFDLGKCRAKLDEFIKQRKTSQHICGICVRACPGKRRSAQSTEDSVQK